jgi:hypothetical protein
VSGGEEGWYEDPYGLHQDRWFSDGQPTKLVRDSGIESYDPLSQGAAPTRALVRSHSEQAIGSGDLRRADDPRAGVDPDYSGMGEVEKYGPLPGRD